MSNSERPAGGSVALNLCGIHGGANVTVFDGHDNAVCGPVLTSNDLTCMLPRGLYVVRVEQAGRMRETAVRLAEATSLGGLVPRPFTAAPLAGAATSHEYYSETSHDLSLRTTCQPIGSDEAGLFIFIRAVNREATIGVELEGGLLLLAPDGAPVSSFEQSQTKRDRSEGWIALSAPAAPGCYSLRFSGNPEREIPIHLFQGWQTQVFVMHHGRPLLEDMRIFSSRLGEGFHEGDPIALTVDVALEGFKNGEDFLTPASMQLLLDGKFSNPMLGLLAAHVLLRQLRGAAVRAVPGAADPDLLNTVLANLKTLIPGSVDLSALDLMWSTLNQDSVPRSLRFTHPPMFRAGLGAVIDAAIDQPGLIPDESIINDIAPRLYADSPWTTWRPLSRSFEIDLPELELKAPSSTGSGPGMLTSAWRGLRSKAFRLKWKTASPPKPLDPTSDWLETALLDEAVRTHASLEPTVGRKELDVTGLARRLGVTRQNVVGAANRLASLSPNEIRKGIAFGGFERGKTLQKNTLARIQDTLKLK